MLYNKTNQNELHQNSLVRPEFALNCGTLSPYSGICPRTIHYVTARRIAIHPTSWSFCDTPSTFDKSIKGMND